jgi:hypothetical protein
MNDDEARRVVEEVAVVYDAIGPGYAQNAPLLREVARRLGIALGDPHQLSEQQVVLDAWYALFPEGLLGWGYDLANVEAPFFHVTERGKRALRSRRADE